MTTDKDMAGSEIQGVSISKAAEILGRSPKTVLRWIRSGRLKAHKEEVDGREKWVVDGLVDQDIGQDMTKTDVYANVLAAKDKTIAVLEAEIITLKAELEATNERLREAHILIGQQEQKIKDLPEIKPLPSPRKWWQFWRRQ